MEKKPSILHKIHLCCIGFRILFKTSALYTILIVFLNITSGIVAPLNAFAYQYLLDDIVKMLQAEKWSMTGFHFFMVLAILSIISFTLNGVIDFIKQIFSDKLDLYITETVLKKTILLPMQTFDNAEIYNHINMAVTRTSSSCLNLLEAISEIIYSVVKGIAFLYIILNFSWPVAVVSMMSMIPLLNLSVAINKYWYQIYFQRIEKNRLIQYLKMLLIKNSFIKEIKLFNVGEFIIDYIKECFSNFIQEDMKRRKEFLYKKTIVQFLDDLVTIGLKIWLVVLSIMRSCTLGNIVLYINSLDDLKLSYNQLIRQFSMLQNSIQYLESLDIVEQEKEDSTRSGIDFDKDFREIEFRNVSFKYPGCDQYVLKDISVKFERGKTFFIVGLNGSGKTTLIKLLLRLYKPVQGEILIDGVNIHSINLSQYYANIGAIFQDFIEYPFDVYKNVAIRMDKQSPNRFDEVLDCVELRDFVNGLPQQEKTLLLRDWTGGIDLSQGQWQKLAIARCIFGNSCISILDEPFSAVDAESEYTIISKLRRSMGNSLIIYITHRFSSISNEDVVVVLKNGSIVEIGTHEELIENKNIYYRLFNSQKFKNGIEKI